MAALLHSAGFLSVFCHFQVSSNTMCMFHGLSLLLLQLYHVVLLQDFIQETKGKEGINNAPSCVVEHLCLELL